MQSVNISHSHFNQRNCVSSNKVLLLSNPSWIIREHQSNVSIYSFGFPIDGFHEENTTFTWCDSTFPWQDTPTTQPKVLHSFLMNWARMWTRPQSSIVNSAMRWETKSNVSVCNVYGILASSRWKTRPLLLLVLPLSCHFLSLSNSKSFNKLVEALLVFILFYFFAPGSFNLIKSLCLF